MHNLTRQEIFFLQCLFENGGRRTIDANTDFRQYDQLVDAGYVKVKPNRFSANILYFTITDAGRQTLEAAEHGKA